MDERTVTGVVGILIAIAFAVVGVSTFFESFLIDVPAEARVGPTLAALVIVALVVVGLAALGVRYSRFLQNPYW